MGFHWEISPVLRLAEQERDKEYRWLLIRLAVWLRKFWREHPDALPNLQLSKAKEGG